MIKFDITKLTTEIVYLKSITTALGGSISVIDQEKSSDKKEVLKRIDTPLAVARSFIQRHKKVTKYLKPTLTAVIKYDGMVVALERHPLGALGELEEEGLFGKKTWEPSAVANIEQYIKPIVDNRLREWFFDGRYIYSFSSKDMDAVMRESQFLTSDGKYRKVVATTLDIQEVHAREKLLPSERSCLAFVTKDMQYAVSPPIWKDLSDVGTTQLKKAGVRADEEDEAEDDEDNTGSVKTTVKPFSFDEIDTHLSVNLNFALKAGQEVGGLFGYDAVQPLQLPRLMVELRTVNLPNIPKQVKATYDIGIRFTHALAWLLGLSKKTDTLESMLVVRSLMKYLTQRGVFRNNVFSADRVFLDGMTVANVPLVSDTNALAAVDRFELIQQAMKNKKMHDSSAVASVGTLATEV